MTKNILRTLALLLAAGPAIVSAQAPKDAIVVSDADIKAVLHGTSASAALSDHSEGMSYLHNLPRRLRDEDDQYKAAAVGTAEHSGISALAS